MAGDTNGVGVLEIRKLANHHRRVDTLQAGFWYWITLDP
jgi:hypothetical protein